MTIGLLAQDPQLFENDWYLQKVVIDNIDYFPPNNAEVDIVSLTILENYIYTLVCSSISSSFITITNDFINVELFYMLLNSDCELVETLTFSNIYFNMFFNWQEPNNIYSYIIETGTDDIKTLTLTNNSDYKAIYTNVLLPIQDFENLSFEIYPNPVKDIFYIENNNGIIINSIKIYDHLGRLVVQEVSNFNQLDISHLSSGLFFIKLETDRGFIAKKIIKE